MTYDYAPNRYPPFAVTVDIAIFTIRDDALQVLLIERGKEPFLGALALPGGFVLPDEDLDQAAARELAEETGLRPGSWHLEELGSYGAPGRDPRMRVVTIAYWAICAELPGLRGGGDAAAAILRPVEEIEWGRVRLAFDHERIVRDAVERARSKLGYTALAARFCPPEFTIGQLRHVFETVWNTDLDPGNFHRSVQESGAFEKRVEAAAAPRSPRGRPASLWSVSESTVPGDRPAKPLARPLAKRGRAARIADRASPTAAPDRKDRSHSMPTTRTSKSHPLRIGAVSPGDGQGRIGITLCPGKTDPDAMTGAWARDLGIDLDAIRDWGATAVLSLITDEEIKYLRVGDLGKAVRDRHMEWWHVPIPDGMPPQADFEEAWKVVGEAIRDRLRLGFDVLVHCKGGLGRAGTVAARLLVELEARPHDAIRDVRVARPGAIENRLQETHVERCTPRGPAAPARTADGIRDRALGAFLGLAVGDAVGTTLEFRPRDTQPRLEDMVGGGPFDQPPGGWTDDTSMALALADSLAACGTLDCRDLMDRFVRWWREGEYSHMGGCFDIGTTTREALQRYQRTGDPLAGSTDRWSAGNGSLMRLAPVAVRFWDDRPRAIAAAAEQSRTTHGAEEAVDACREFAELLADAIAGSPRADALAPRPFQGAPAIARIMAGSWRGRARDTIRSSGYVVHTLEAAIWSVARTGDFRNAVLLAANLGDDADTVAAVTGQLAGALYGLSGIPDRWRERVIWKDRLLAAGRRLLPPSLANPEESG